MAFDSESGYEPIDEQFPVVMFGYDRTAVDAYVDDLLEHAGVLARDNRRVASLEQELAAAQAEVLSLQRLAAAKGPAMAASTEITELMRSAEAAALTYRAQAHDLVAQAELEADRIRRQAREDALITAAALRNSSGNGNGHNGNGRRNGTASKLAIAAPAAKERRRNTR
ncbi:DivIVA domain-containing protein [Catelliglobosispora koreensis]|uniref:DivIVA domain-containing protein n=1 Tax=Catelliglobosispora koreensis TaxID=129052 RepID=UPI00047618A0|nr:DivIVA domain-containing protein [Catelliglobosispora koreensis]